jgi:hypothetical protein
LGCGRSAALAYLDSLVYNLYGVTAFIVQVDGHTTILDDS